jgi:hypothetical protein
MDKDEFAAFLKKTFKISNPRDSDDFDSIFLYYQKENTEMITTNIFALLDKEKRHISKEFGICLNLIREIIIDQFLLLKTTNWLTRIAIGVKDYDNLKLLYTSYVKNLINLLAIYKLINENLYGSARLLMRNTFESLVLSKYSYISKDPNILKRWDAGEHINISSEVINKIKHNSELTRIKNDFNRFTHFSIYSIQGSIKYEKKEIISSLMYLFFLLQMNFTLYHRYMINQNSLKDIMLRDQLEKEYIYYRLRYVKLKQELILLKKILNFNLNGRKAIREFDGNWKLK